jgi:glutathione S-transferase
MGEQDDDGHIVYESRAISRYIAAKAGASSLYPIHDVKALGRAEQAASVESSNFDPYASGICVQRVFIPRRGGKPDEAKVEELEKTLAAKLEGYERILSKSKYLAGDQLTLGDVFHLPYGAMAESTGVTLLSDAEKYPNVAR